jgi:hypothetical protein
LNFERKRNEKINDAKKAVSNSGPRTRSCASLADGGRRAQPGNGEARVIVQENLYKEKFYKEFIELMTRPTPAAQK